MTNTVVVAGGTGALGAAVTAEFLRSGWRVVVPGRTEESLARLGTHPALNPVLADPFDPAGTADVVALATSDEAAPLTALVNLVGGFASGERVHEQSAPQLGTARRSGSRVAGCMSQLREDRRRLPGRDAVPARESGSSRLADAVGITVTPPGRPR